MIGDDGAPHKHWLLIVSNRKPFVFSNSIYIPFIWDTTEVNSWIFFVVCHLNSFNSALLSPSDSRQQARVALTVSCEHRFRAPTHALVVRRGLITSCSLHLFLLNVASSSLVVPSVTLGGSSCKILGGDILLVSTGKCSPALPELLIRLRRYTR